jgi:hypothetical protein
MQGLSGIASRGWIARGNAWNAIYWPGGETRFVVVSPMGDRLYSFSDLLEANAEADELSRHLRSSRSAAA